MYGIPAPVQGHYVSRGSDALYDPETAEHRKHAVEVKPEHIGRVAIFHGPMRVHHHKQSH